VREGGACACVCVRACVRLCACSACMHAHAQRRAELPPTLALAIWYHLVPVSTMRSARRSAPRSSIVLLSKHHSFKQHSTRPSYIWQGPAGNGRRREKRLGSSSGQCHALARMGNFFSRVGGRKVRACTLWASTCAWLPATRASVAACLPASRPCMQANACVRACQLCMSLSCCAPHATGERNCGGAGQ